MLQVAETRNGKLVCGDNVAFLKTCAPCMFDATVTSPPYDDMRTYTGESEWGWESFTALAQQIYRVTKEGGVVVWNVADRTKKGAKTCTSFKQILYFVECGFSLVDTMIWEKTGTSLGSHRLYYPNYEFMFVLSRGRHAKFNPIKDRKNVVSGPQTAPISAIDSSGKGRAGRRQVVSEAYGKRNNVWRMAPQQKSEHPAPFPLPLARDHILSWTDTDDLILDPFMGSGTTACAAIATGRRWVGVDVSAEYCALAWDRIQQFDAAKGGPCQVAVC